MFNDENNNVFITKLGAGLNNYSSEKRSVQHLENLKAERHHHVFISVRLNRESGGVHSATFPNSLFYTLEPWMKEEKKKFEIKWKLF